MMLFDHYRPIPVKEPRAEDITPLISGVVNTVDCMAVSWIMQISTEPEVLNAAVRMVPHIEWSTHHDFKAIVMRMDRRVADDSNGSHLKAYVHMVLHTIYQEDPLDVAFLRLPDCTGLNTVEAELFTPSDYTSGTFTATIAWLSHILPLSIIHGRLMGRKQCFDLAYRCLSDSSSDSIVANGLLSMALLLGLKANPKDLLSSNKKVIRDKTVEIMLKQIPSWIPFQAVHNEDFLLRRVSELLIPLAEEVQHSRYSHICLSLKELQSLTEWCLRLFNPQRSGFLDFNRKRGLLRMIVHIQTLRMSGVLDYSLTKPMGIYLDSQRETLMTFAVQIGPDYMDDLLCDILLVLGSHTFMTTLERRDELYKEYLQCLLYAMHSPRRALQLGGFAALSVLLLRIPLEAASDYPFSQHEISTALWKIGHLIHLGTTELLPTLGVQETITLRYIRLVCQLFHQPQWMDQIVEDGHLEYCINIARDCIKNRLMPYSNDEDYSYDFCAQHSLLCCAQLLSRIYDDHDDLDNRESKIPSSIQENLRESLFLQSWFMLTEGVDFVIAATEALSDKGRFVSHDQGSMIVLHQVILYAITKISHYTLANMKAIDDSLDTTSGSILQSDVEELKNGRNEMVLLANRFHNSQLQRERRNWRLLRPEVNRLFNLSIYWNVYRALRDPATWNEPATEKILPSILVRTPDWNHETMGPSSNLVRTDYYAHDDQSIAPSSEIHADVGNFPHATSNLDISYNSVVLPVLGPSAPGGLLLGIMI
ncbi:hypothetical protein M422DRAFT_49126 [Sphaerobolus stellatus SS14]|uniref:Uncharacterized protein n=1 Tax=Sphaerobolus stellatus (strain SS14) TaxID=990650 RepID=A0A0C9UBV9_SPHS4|nr:hypothetical protein M422DRAFT_49126 [Sphaerobolus stellatus SS14]